MADISVIKLPNGSEYDIKDESAIHSIKTINNTSLLGNGNLNIEGVPHVDLTQAQYDALTSAEKNNGTIYFITDGSSSGGNSFTPYSVETYTVSAGDVGTIHENTYLYKFGQVVVLNIRVASLPSGVSGEQIIANIPVAIAPENTIIQYPGMFGSSSTSQSPPGYVFVKADGTVGANSNVINANTGIAANITWILNDN